MLQNYKEVQEVLFTKLLVLYPPENEAAKIYAEFMQKHPELNIKDINMRIDEEEREEDYYGNGGGVDRTLVIYKLRRETDGEYNERSRKERLEIVNRFLEGLNEGIRKFQSDIRRMDDKSIQEAYGKLGEVFTSLAADCKVKSSGSDTDEINDNKA